jgi:hypothetical protein
MENIAKYSTIMDAALNIARIVLMVLGSICFIGALVVLLAPASVIYDGALASVCG